MYKNLLLSLCTLTALSATAQPTITAASNPGDNDVEIRYFSNAQVAPGPAGANATWDLSTTAFTAGQTTGTYDACPGATGCSSFPGSTIAVETNGEYGYFIANNQRLALNGVSAAGAVITYTDAEDYLRYPMNYQNTFTDDFKASFVLSGTTLLRGGSVHVMADGYGTLKLPNVEFANVLRVHMMEDYADTIMGAPAITYTVHSYLWYAPYHHRALAGISSISVNGGSPQHSAYYVENFPTSVANTNGIAGKMSIYPNPTTGSITLTLPQGTQAATAAVTVTDITGRSLPVAIATAANTCTIHAATLPAGIYLLHVRTAQGRETLKFEKQ